MGRGRVRGYIFCFLFLRISFELALERGFFGPSIFCYQRYRRGMQGVAHVCECAFPPRRKSLFAPWQIIQYQLLHQRGASETRKDGERLLSAKSNKDIHWLRLNGYRDFAFTVWVCVCTPQTIRTICLQARSVALNVCVGVCIVYELDG